MFRSVNLRESRTVTLALSILRGAANDMSVDNVQSSGVQLALRVLLPFVGRHDLMTFWRIATNENRMQRRHNLRRVLSCIESQAWRGRK